MYKYDQIFFFKSFIDVALTSFQWSSLQDPGNRVREWRPTTHTSLVSPFWEGLGTSINYRCGSELDFRDLSTTWKSAVERWRPISLTT